SLPFVPFALVVVIFLHIVVGVVYCTKRTKDPRVHYSTGDGDDGVDCTPGETRENMNNNYITTTAYMNITAHTGGSVLLPCSCTDLQTKPEEFIWKKENRNTQERKEIFRESGQYRNRVQLVNDHSPGNLSLLISHLTEGDGGDYECAVKGSHILIRLTLEGKTLKSLPFVPFALVTVIFLHIVVGVVYRTRRTKDPRVHYSTGDGEDGVVGLE
ncbi:hypothetical protein NFI96_032746, partial [Prochilodus magdalenae]